ncbi:MAG: hypothetical protein CO150_07760 [Nitrospirae bacterium CG_4_9_14_3_um_filter_53_35]|nr:MAG: hypothetical protein AUK29_09270 [Nitrospirae bacterium CG2_30_53_67]PIS36889.1 MAG: hypothetical protein COT35_08755 [Nitrospirae bacterium CG08_land_8_20_14_0_20_52_24]PIV84016.1 MAG: hypothetical protein COW52_07990 [Nitrospirae bacterium CG17_big_fil_post_rev_8_21_14_2_50_50_9]PIW84546.1 MAG: hypothetical protein COZ95_09320 [Nitrospirae bacterium CG_4_8_14_3_um_filter_50_41]PIX86305.1 MAG: hypothetical protein COZ32_03945 [Nitrospirae bacterium CG_4_10_14_3_um_filter_53_41]PJA7357
MTDETEFPNVLHGLLWHATHPDRYQKILEAGLILPNPPIPDCERWKTGGGPEYYPYVRTLGGVSLFDFYGFEPESYSAKYPLSTWQEFVPYRHCWGISVWIEIDRHTIADHFVSAETLLKRWHQDKAYGHTIMPKIEAAYLGPIPVRAFRRVFISGVDVPCFEEVPIEPQREEL